MNLFENKNVFNERLNTASSIYHLTHTDGDAVGCAVVLEMYKNLLFPFMGQANLVNTKIKTFYCGNGKIDETIEREVLPDKETDKVLIISDNTCSLSMWENLKKRKSEFSMIILIDHHKTNPIGNFDDDDVMCSTISDKAYVSAAAQMFEIFILDNVEYMRLANKRIGASYEKLLGATICNLHHVISSISRYDTWAWMEIPSDFYKFRLGDSCKDVALIPDNQYQEDLIAVICQEIGLEKTTRLIINHLMDLMRSGDIIHDKYLAFPKVFYTVYDLILEKLQKAVRDSEKKTVIKHVKFKGQVSYRTAIILADDSSRKVPEHLLSAYDKIDIVLMLFVDSCTLSFRSKGELDVSEIAKRFGGGGHLNAAGAKPGWETFKEYLELYFDGMDNLQTIEYLNMDTLS